MIVEVDVNISKFPNKEILEALEEAIDAKAIKGYHSDQYIEKMKPKIEEMQSKLAEISVFILGY